MGDNAGAAAVAATTATPAAPAAPAAGLAPDLKAIPGGAQGAPKPVPGQAPGQPKLYEVKVDGKVVQMTEAELIQNATLGKAAFKRMEEATMTKRQAEAFIEKFRRDPMAALEDPALGLNADQRRAAIEKYYKERYIDQDKLTPEQKRIQEQDAELKKYRDKEVADQKAAEQRQAQELQNYWRGQYEKQIIETLEKTGLPRTAYTVGRMAFYMQQAAKHKFQAPMEMIAEHVRNDYQEQFRSFTQNSPAEALIQFLGPDAAKKIQRYALQKHKEKLAEGFTPPEPKDVTTAPKKKIGGVDAAGWKGVNKYWTRRDR